MNIHNDKMNPKDLLSQYVIFYRPTISNQGIKFSHWEDPTVFPTSMDLPTARTRGNDRTCTLVREEHEDCQSWVFGVDPKHPVVGSLQELFTALGASSLLLESSEAETFSTSPERVLRKGGW